MTSSWIYIYIQDNPINVQCVSRGETEALGTNRETTVTKELCKSSATGGERLRLAQLIGMLKSQYGGYLQATHIY